MRILIFTDSRGQHKPAGQNHPMFAERLAADPRVRADVFLCPMKWTTTLDFLERFPLERLAAYDAVVLYTGIVDWSPRPVSSAVYDLYNNHKCSNEDNLGANTRDYSLKIVNNKKKIFDEVFGENRILSYLEKPFDAEYNGEKTINMYGLEMAKDCLLPRLAQIPNLIFITSNRFVPGWDGDYKKGRPANIGITHAYSDLFAEQLQTKHRLIDLREWDNTDVVRFTCDNLHLNKTGSDFIFKELQQMLELDRSKLTATSLDTKVHLQSPERITSEKKEQLLRSVNAEGFLATLVIGLRIKNDDPIRLANLSFLLKWLDHYYGDLFEILLVEQDAEPRIDPSLYAQKPNYRYTFLFNPSEYNRGWGYNVAVQHFCKNSKVVALMDTDVLTSRNFLREVLDCHRKYDAISPYQNIYYTDPEEAEQTKRSMQLERLNNLSHIKNPVTLAGGILIIRRGVFLAVKGFEQYVGYGCEDRSLDVTLLNHLPEERIRIAPFAYAHLHHERDADARTRFDEIYSHLTSNYGCNYSPGLAPNESIHTHCKHVGIEQTLAMMRARAEQFADPDLYRKGELTANGIPLGASRPKSNRVGVVYPPDFKSLFDYREKEVYNSAPPPDSLELATFYNAYRGKRCFIIGNGPSLNKHDLSLLGNEYTFGVNSFYYKTRETGFMPFFYVVEDSSVMKENIEEIREYDAPFKFFPTNYKNLHPKQPNTFFFRMNRGFYEKSSPNYAVPRFSTDAAEVLYCGQSVTYINLQLAYFMGFEEVYLIGMDFSYVIPESHARTGDVLLSDTDDPNHFHKDYFGKGKTWKDPKLDRVALNYRMAKLVYEAAGRAIYNATIGGSLEIFPRADYLGLFGAGTQRISASQEIPNLRDANRLYRIGDFSAALSSYAAIAQGGNGLSIYRRCAVDSYMRAVEAGQSCAANDVAYVRGLLMGM